MTKFIKFSILGLLVMASYITSAQNHIGVKASYQLSKINIDGLGTSTLGDTKNLENFATGIVYQTNFSESFFFRPEFIYNKKGFDAKVEKNVNIFGNFDLPVGGGLKTEFHYVEIPLNVGLSYDLGKAKIQVYAGPTVGYAAKAVLKPYATALITINLGEYDLDLTTDTYSRFELGGNLGVNFAIPVGQGEILLDGRFNRSFTNFLDDPIIDIKINHQSFAFGVGYIHRIGV